MANRVKTKKQISNSKVFIAFRKMINPNRLFNNWDLKFLFVTEDQIFHIQLYLSSRSPSLISDIVVLIAGAAFHFSTSKFITKSLYLSSFIGEIVAAVPAPNASTCIPDLYVSMIS